MLIASFIDAFRNIVLATTVDQMHERWRTLILENKDFPLGAVEYVQKEYYLNENAKKFMECYVHGCGNLHQTTTSRNEGSHAAYRSKTTNIPKLTESYMQRRIHRKEWMARLRAEAAQARDRIPVDIQMNPELREVAGKISKFALTEIRRQITFAKKREEKYGHRDRSGECNCYAFVRYGLPCSHMVPTDGSPIQLANISPMWRLDNWDQGWVFCITTYMKSCRLRMSETIYKSGKFRYQTTCNLKTSIVLLLLTVLFPNSTAIA